MSTIVIIGAQWGDEGKGKVVDLLAEKANVVIRYAGGPNAGHTLVVGEERMVFRLVPSGVLHGHTTCLLGQGMVINPAVLAEELQTLTSRGINLSDADGNGRLHLSEHAHLIMPYHVQIDGLREASKKGTKIGTTKRGIGPCYEDKVGRRGVRASDLRDLDTAKARAAEALDAWAPTVAALGGELPSVADACRELDEHAARLVPLLADTSQLAEGFIREGKSVLLEGAQGTLLDIDHGTYPFVTSSSAVAGGACTGAGIGPTRLSRVLGITKAYTTRVGEGPFPTEQPGAAGKHMQDKGGEFGSVTGRPRRCGWLDIAGLRYSRRVNGLDGLAITKLDVLSGLSEIKVCMGYDTPAGHVNALPVGKLDVATPVYETLPGWSEDITACRSLDALPQAALAYVRFIEEQTELTADLVSVGPRRDETIVVRDSFS
jgi:adenylosuccinate synthase